MQTARPAVSMQLPRQGQTIGSSTADPSPEPSALALLLRVEQLARKAATVANLQQLAANETRKLNRARQIFVVDLAAPRRPRVVAVSGVGAVDGASMMSVAVSDLVCRVAADKGLQKPVDFKLPAYTQPASDLATSYPFRDMLWVPLLARDGVAFAGLLLARDTVWSEADIAVSARLAETYAHAWHALEGKRRISQRAIRPYVLPAAVAATLLSALALPIPMTALAPAEVVAAEPMIVSAPIDGVIESIDVDPGQVVKVGDVLVRLADTVLRNKVEVARREVAVAEARIKQASILGMTDARGRHELGIAEADLELKRAELNFASDVLSRTVIKAGRSGIAAYPDRKTLIGRPVATGERILEVTDPAAVEVRIDVTMPDAAALIPQGRIKLFLDVDPLTPKNGRITRSDYKARPGDSDVLVFKTFALLDPGEKLPRIGLRGTAQIYGEPTLLGLFLFRRPLAVVRQYIGL
jgi:Biotin-lipoyl like